MQTHARLQGYAPIYVRDRPTQNSPIFTLIHADSRETFPQKVLGPDFHAHSRKFTHVHAGAVAFTSALFYMFA